MTFHFVIYKVINRGKRLRVNYLINDEGGLGVWLPVVGSPLHQVKGGQPVFPRQIYVLLETQVDVVLQTRDFMLTRPSRSG